MEIGFPIASGGSGSTYTEVATYADLPLASTVSGKIYVVTTTAGIIFINRKLAGYYRSDGVNWNYLGDVTSYVDLISDQTVAGIKTFTATISASNLSGTNTGDQDVISHQFLQTQGVL